MIKLNYIFFKNNFTVICTKPAKTWPWRVNLPVSHASQSQSQLSIQYFNLLVSGSRRFEWWKKLEAVNLVGLSLLMLKLLFCFIPPTLYCVLYLFEESAESCRPENWPHFLYTICISWLFFARLLWHFSLHILGVIQSYRIPNLSRL